MVATVRGDQRARLVREKTVLGVYPVRQLVPATVAESVATALGDAVKPIASGLPGDGGGVTIAVLDGPIDETHAALLGRVDHPAGAAPGSSDATAEHGTAIASLASGGAGPAGLHGVAPAARILAIRVLDARCRRRPRRHHRRPSGRPRAGRRPRRQRRPRRPRPRGRCRRRGAFAAFDDAPEARAIADLDQLGTVVVAPAGNDGPTGARYGSLSSPGSAADALTVGASDGRPALPQVALEFGGAVAERVGAAALAGALAPPAGQALPVKTITGAARTTHTAGALASDYQGPDGATLVAGAAVLVPRDGGECRVLGGTLSRSSGVEPEDLRLPQLYDGRGRHPRGRPEQPTPTTTGEATALHIAGELHQRTPRPRRHPPRLRPAGRRGPRVRDKVTLGRTLSGRRAL